MLGTVPCGINSAPFNNASPSALNTESQLALVTGASRGIGKQIAITLAATGMPVVLVARSDKDISEIRNYIIDGGGQAFAYPCDITIAADVRAMRSDIDLEIGPLTLLINNAGIAPSAKLEATTDEEWRETFAVNTDGPFYLLREFLPAMKARGNGHVISIASTAALQGFRYTAAYTASKHALLGLMRAAHEEFSPAGLRFSTICPGFVRTAIFESAVHNTMGRTGASRDEAEAIFAAMNREGKIIEPLDIAETVAKLATAEHIKSGLTYHADGTVIEPIDFS